MKNKYEPYQFRTISISSTSCRTKYIDYEYDPNPAKSKSKCIFMVGKSKNVTKQAALLLEGRKLPWVEFVTHHGHELHQSGTLVHDAKIKRAEFISSSVEVTVQASMEQCCGTLQERGISDS